MKSLTQKERRALSPVCPPRPLALYALSAGLVVALIALSVPAREVALLLAAAAVSAIAVTNPAMATVLVRSVGNVLARAAMTGRASAALAVTS